MPSASILCFAGSTRKNSFNKSLVRVAMLGAEETGATTTFLDLAQYPLPLFNEDLEQESGLPENAKLLKKLMIEHHGLIVSSPEYNSSVSPLLKNAIDWISRDSEGEAQLSLTAYKHKVAGLLAASPGAMGGLRGLFHLRDIFQNIGVIVCPEMFALPHAFDAFSEDGSLKNDKYAGMAKAVGRQVADICTAQRALVKC
ncbi:MAG: NAD(P)H-dependent oxidoreductase [Candidatus Obscuribacterales bacterium]|nr:NAD(P)H-dependent oxidoreductase [Candidatus Obscuribacterales bacterium]